MHPSSNGGQHPTKKVQKNRNNYASVECGAKILAANPEAKVTMPLQSWCAIFGTAAKDFSPRLAVF